MPRSIDDTRKTRGRPFVGATQLGFRLPPDQLAKLDAWIAAQPDPKPSRPEGVRRLMEIGLSALADQNRR